MSALTRVTVQQSYSVVTDIVFDCPLEIAELYKELNECGNFVDIEEVDDIWNYHREHGIEEPGTYMIWEEDDGTKKSYKLKNYSIDSGDAGEMETDSITLEPAE